MEIATTYTPKFQIIFSDEEMECAFQFGIVLDALAKRLKYKDDELLFRSGSTYAEHKITIEEIETARKISSLIYAYRKAEIRTTHEIETVKIVES